MDSQTLERLIEKRDETVRDLGRFLPSTISSLLDGQKVTLFDGIVVSKIDEEFKARGGPSNGWYAEDLDRRELVLSVVDNDVEQFFKMGVYYDSWDNGDPDEWKIDETVEVQKVPVQKFVWKEV